MKSALNLKDEIIENVYLKLFSVIEFMLLVNANNSLFINNNYISIRNFFIELMNEFVQNE